MNSEIFNTVDKLLYLDAWRRRYRSPSSYERAIEQTYPSYANLLLGRKQPE